MKQSTTEFYDLRPRDLKGRPFYFDQLKGKIVVIVNTASRCGFNEQFQGLEALHKKFAGQPVEIIGFPCNQFKQQEPEDDTQIAIYYKVYFGITFPILAKINTNGPQADPVYRYLKKQKRGVLGLARIKWNFEKFLIDAQGNVVARFSTFTTPEAIGVKIEEMLRSMQTTGPPAATTSGQ
ncbi:Peroxiredoxin HYR1 [Candida viswanathii]|uniref:Glutathione peroxidase n=1 Tax=Candida viswanathii TaxID=5486 RepID=A0A367XWI1_9ASCO|nr:Peroxiredoxin HYR1 [Candida viswanathii]